MTSEITHFDGGCTCQYVRYRLLALPLFVHCCHCYWCQRETGSAFALNALIEINRMQLLQGDVTIINTPTAGSGQQKIARCPRCHVALWSHYRGAGKAISFVRVGTLDTPSCISPDIHIYTPSKQPWVTLPPETPAVLKYYKIDSHWPKESLERRAIAMKSKDATIKMPAT